MPTLDVAAMPAEGVLASRAKHAGQRQQSGMLHRMGGWGQVGGRGGEGAGGWKGTDGDSKELDFASWRPQGGRRGQAGFGVIYTG